MLRIERVLSNRGYCTRGDARAFLRRHDVRVGGESIQKGQTKADPDLVTIDGQPIDPPTLLIMLHKPPGVTCSHREAGPLVYDMLPQRWQRRKPAITTVGRLDKETSGVLLLSDDGALVHRLTSPKHHVPRVYIARLRDPLRGDEAVIFASGKLKLDNEEKPLLPAEMQTIDGLTARLTLHEGRYHQVRRMFAAAGNHVESLHREKFGAIYLGDLAPGAWRVIDPAILEP